MASTIRVDIVSAEGEIYSGDATMVFAPASQGDLGAIRGIIGHRAGEGIFIVRVGKNSQ